MQRYIAKRALLAIPTVLGVVVIVFFLVRLAPTDVADRLTGDSLAAGDQEVLQQIREDLGLEGSTSDQLTRYLLSLARGDFGTSYYSGQPVIRDIVERLPVSVQLGTMSIALALLIGLPVGTVAALKQDTAIDYLLRGGVVLFLAMPAFWMAILILMFGANQFGLDLGFKWSPPGRYYDLWDRPYENLLIMILPSAILAVHIGAIYARYLRTTLLEVFREDYVRTARGKGLSESSVILRHAFPNALIPVVTVIGLSLPIAITGAVILERIFGIPGLGRYFIENASRADYPAIQALTILVAVFVVTVNLVVDLSYAVLDPRIRETSR